MCEKGDLTQCNQLNNHAKILNETNNPSNHGKYYVPLNAIIKDTTNLDPLLLSSMGNNVNHSDFINRFSTIQNINPLITDGGNNIKDIYKNQQDLDDLMTYTNAKVAFCLHLNNENNTFKIPSINTGYIPIVDNKEYNVDTKSPLINSLYKHEIILNNTNGIGKQLANVDGGDNPFSNMKKSNAKDNAKYYCNTFMPIYCQNVVNYIKNKMGGACSQGDLTEFAPQCACFGTTYYELISQDKTVMDQLNKQTTAKAYIASLKGNPRKCELAQCEGKYSPDNSNINCPGNNIQICGVDLSMSNSDIEARNNVLVNMRNNCNMIAANANMPQEDSNQSNNSSSDETTSKPSNNDSEKDNETKKPNDSYKEINETKKQNDNSKKDNETKEPNDSYKEVIDTSKEVNETKESNDEYETDNDTSKKDINPNNKSNNNTSTNQNNTSTEKSNKTLYIILAIIAIIVVIIIIIIIIVVSKKKSTSGGAPHIADFGHLIRSSRK